MTLAEAKAYMRNKGVEEYNYKIEQGAGTTTPEKEETAYYAIANGHKPGIRKHYQ